VIRSLTVTESSPRIVDLTPDEAMSLQRLGIRLASRKGWWGAVAGDDVERSVIRCRPAGGNAWEIRISDAVGLISIGSLQILVEPKIPIPHLLYLFGRSGEFPRLEEHRGEIEIGESLLELIATWFIRTTERVMRRDLVRDYMPITEAVRSVRGSVHALSTARNYYSGRLEFECSFEEFGYDTDLNRAIRAAARIVASNPQLVWATRRRARAILSRMDEVGEFDLSRPWPKLDRRTSHYSDALSLAAHLLRSDNRDLRHGGADAWTFLIKTPDMIETAIRAILREAFPGIHKSVLQLTNSSMTLNPDLVIGAGMALADVKYKLSRPDWDRPDLYQLVAFATGFHAPHAALVDFSAGPAARETIRIGDVTVRHVAWPIDPAMSASDAHARFLSEFEAWYRRCASPAADAVPA